jgi:acetyl esterase/lipase
LTVAGKVFAIGELRAALFQERQKRRGMCAQLRAEYGGNRARFHLNTRHWINDRRPQRRRCNRLALQLLVYPILDYAVDTGCYLRFARAYTGFAGDRGWGPASLDDLRYMWESYVPDPAVRLEPGAAPMRAETLTGCALAFIVSAEHDILRGEAVEYARWLRAEDVGVELHEYAGHIHGFFHMLGTTEAAQDAHSLTTAALRAALRAGHRGMAGLRATG